MRESLAALFVIRELVPACASRAEQDDVSRRRRLHRVVHRPVQNLALDRTPALLRHCLSDVRTGGADRVNRLAHRACLNKRRQINAFVVPASNEMHTRRADAFVICKCLHRECCGFRGCAFGIVVRADSAAVAIRFGDKLQAMRQARERAQRLIE